VSVAGVLLGVRASYQGALADTAELSAIVVTATRVAESSVDLPVSVDRVDRRAIADGQLQVNLSESLITVPGVSVQSRQNYAQDLQLSVRGFGARSSFGVRGIRLYSDGIPGTMPDGQGQFSQFDLGSADHIEVLRGPFSALYGNSSGGVIAIFTEDAKPGYSLDGTAEYGTFNTQRYALKTGGDDGAVNYVVDAAHFQTDGYRFHSDAERDNFNSKLRIATSDTSKLTLVANVVETPSVQDPLGLTRAQLAADPRQACLFGADPDVPFVVFQPAGDEPAGQAGFPREQRRCAIRADVPKTGAIFDGPQPALRVGKKTQRLVVAVGSKFFHREGPLPVRHFLQPSAIPEPQATVGRRDYLPQLAWRSSVGGCALGESGGRHHSELLLGREPEFTGGILRHHPRGRRET